jgi:hypothetical protein
VLFTPEDLVAEERSGRAVHRGVPRSQPSVVREVDGREMPAMSTVHPFEPPSQVQARADQRERADRSAGVHAQRRRRTVEPHRRDVERWAGNVEWQRDSTSPLPSGT